MLPNLHSIYAESEMRAKWSIFGLFSLLVASIVGVVFVSPSLVVGVVLACVVTLITFMRPTWVLAFLPLYLPFEPFILKWIPDGIYVYARYGSEMLVYLLVAVVLWKAVVGRLKLKPTPIDVAFVLLVFVMAASTVINFLPAMPAILGIRQILRFVLLFFVTVQLAPSKRWVQFVIGALGLILLVQVCLGAAQAVIGEPVDIFLLPGESRSLGEIQLTAGTVQFWDPGQRVFGTLGRYDQLGAFMAFVMLLLVAIIYEKATDEKERLWFWVLLIASLPILALTYSRSAWFGFLLGFLFIGAFIKRDKRVMIAAAVIPMLLMTYILFTGLVVRELVDVSSQSITNRFFEAFSYERWVGEYHGLGRLYWIVQTVAEVVPASPIFGHGPGTYGGGVVAALGNTKVYDELGLPFGVYGTDGYIDNNWMSLWGELGTLGLGVYLWMYFALFSACLLVYKRSDDPQTRALALGTCAAMIAFFLNAFLATFLEVRTIAPYIWIASGTVIALGQREKIL
ncbi:MAG: O-antigen ligase family protein [Patescibacteria group bacterium]